jgi:hypothetical protein
MNLKKPWKQAIKKMDTTKMNRIERNVYGKNLINKLTIKALEKLLPQLEPLTNKKLFLADESSSKDLSKVEKFTYKKGAENVRMYFKKSGSTLFCLSIDVTVKVKNYDTGGYCVNYYKNDIILGNIEDNKLIELSSLDQLKHSYSLGKKLSYSKVKKLVEKRDKIRTDLRNLDFELKFLD